jgi:L-threonylcarbamoyladenylate synthase
MEILTIQKTDKNTLIETACRVLTAGGLVVYPTETMYGIGADATNQKAVDKLLQYKARREGKPLSIAVTDVTMASQFAEINNEATKLYRTLLPGPVTVVSKYTGGLARGVASERQTIGVRIPDYSLVTDIIAAYGKPITASSANASYKKRPYNVSDILNNISDKQKSLIDLILDAGELPRNEPSTVVDTTLEQPTVLRQGQISLTNAVTVTSENEQETIELAKKLVGQYKHYLNEKALIFALVGEMGAGKTYFTKGIAEALGVTRIVNSPTYTISAEYNFQYGDRPNRLVHIDTWRLFSDEEFVKMGFKELVDSMAVFSVEWADKVAPVLNQWSDEAKIVWVKFEYGKTPDERIITYSDRMVQP